MGTFHCEGVSAGTLSGGMYTLTLAQLGDLTVTAWTTSTFPLTYPATVLNADNQSLGTATVTANLVAYAPVASNGASIVTGTVPTTGTLIAVDAENDPLIYSIVFEGAKGVATITNTAKGFKIDLERELVDSILEEGAKWKK